MKTKLFLSILFLLAFLGLEQGNAQNYFQDTVWMRMTDQGVGMFQVKFSNNDSIIWAMGLEDGLFFYSNNGNQIRKIQGNNEVFFLENDTKFLRLNQQRTKFEIFGIQNFFVIDTLENDGTIINEYPKCDVSIDEHYLIAPIPKGFRIWDLYTRKILKTKIIPDEPNLKSAGFANLRLICNSNKIIGQLGKTYYNPNNPDKPITVGNFVIYDFFTMDSIDYFKNSQYFRLSKTCKYIVYGTGDPNYGVEVYDFNTKELLWKIPVNGPSLTGIEFSPDDKYLVTTCGDMKIWDMETGNINYNYKDGSYRNLDISNDGKKIITSVGEYLILYPAKWQGTPVKTEEINPIIIYPNPTNGFITLNFNQQLPEITNINLNNTNGILIRNLYNNFLEPGQQALNFDVNDLANGSYFVNVSSSHENIVFKIIIAK